MERLTVRYEDKKTNGRDNATECLAISAVDYMGYCIKFIDTQIYITFESNFINLNILTGLGGTV
jgi:hypothetical protein